MRLFDKNGESIKNLVKGCFDEESLTDTLIDFTQVLLDLLGTNYSRVVLLIDEAEALVVPDEIHSSQ